MTILAAIFKSTPMIIVLSIFFVFLEFNAPTAFFMQFKQLFNPKELFSFTYLVVYSLFFLFLLPFLIRKHLSQASLRELGLRQPASPRKTLALSIGALVLLLPLVFYSAQFHSVRQFYSLKSTPLYFVFFSLLAMPLYYFAEEFFFRGFLFLGLWKKIGWHSYWITEVIFTWAHLGKPAIELLFAFPAGLVLNYLTLHTRSIYPPMVVHFIMGALLLLLVTFSF